MTAGRRDQLASALREAPWACHDEEDIAEALLPTVDRMIRQAQAEALEDEARHALRIGHTNASRRLRDRAAALRLTTDHPDVTQDAPTTPSEPP